MEDVLTLGLKDLQFIGVICSKCGTEVIFDLERDPGARALTCPTCAEVVLEWITQNPYEFTWVSFLRHVYSADHKHVLRFHVRRRA